VSAEIPANFSTESWCVVDLQCTSSSHSAGSIIEMAWQVFAADKLVSSRHYLIQLPVETKLPPRVAKMTGITTERLEEEGRPLSMVLEEFISACQQLQAIVIHYAQFELGFLTRSGFVVPEQVKVICLHKVARRLMPELPSHSLIALAGFLALEPFTKNSALEHAKASSAIWNQFRQILQTQNIDNVGAVSHWQNQLTTRSREKSYRNFLPEALDLPESPGVYQHLDHHQRVLYVGKAKNLKRRVMSYFTGKQTKGSHLNTMLTQVADVKFLPTRHHTEACMLEARLIKSLRPPYNRQLNRLTTTEAIAWVTGDLDFLDDLAPNALLFWRDSFLIYCQTVYKLATCAESIAETQLHHEPEIIRCVWPLLWDHMGCHNLLRFSLSCHNLVKTTIAGLDPAIADDVSPMVLTEPQLEEAHHEAAWHVMKCFSGLVSSQRRLRLLLNLTHSQLLWWDKLEQGWWELRVERGVYECMPLSLERPPAWSPVLNPPASELMEKVILDQMSILAAEIRRLAKSSPEVHVYCKGVHFHGRRLRNWVLMDEAVL
jgi:DNA polymerase III epsilon subunit-like protein